MLGDSGAGPFEAGCSMQLEERKDGRLKGSRV